MGLAGAQPPDEAGARLGDPVDRVEGDHELRRLRRVQRRPLPGDVGLRQVPVPRHLPAG